jgi:hypothetical protein
VLPSTLASIGALASFADSSRPFVVRPHALSVTIGAVTTTTEAKRTKGTVAHLERQRLKRQTDQRVLGRRSIATYRT